MDSTMFMGLFIGAILALLGGAGIIAKIVVNPVIKLREEITELRGGIGNMKEWKSDVDKHLETHDNNFVEVRKDINRLELDLTKCKSSKAAPAARRKAQ